MTNCRIGSRLDRGKERAWLFSFEGEREISTASLDPCPVDLSVNSKTISLNRSYEDKVVERGEKFIGYVKTLFDRRSLEVIYNGEIVGGGKLKVDANSSIRLLADIPPAV